MDQAKSRILIVDDERSNIQVLNAILQEEYDISVALNGEQALKRTLGEKKPDLILLDVQMSGMDGFEVCRRIVSNPETQDIPVIFITAMTNEKDEEKGFALGAVDYITKPFGPAVVLARIKAHLELKRKRDILKSLSTQDGLTGLANRRRLEDFFEFQWHGCVRSGEPISVIMADIDHFKLYNDHYGHTAGDDCLREVASTLASQVTRQTDLVARYGGEEFACVLPSTDFPGAMAVADKMRLAVQNLGIPHGFSSTAECITVSLGVATAYPKAHGLSSRELFQMADAALYAAKSGGRNRVEGSDGIPGKELSEKDSVDEPERTFDTRQLILIVDDEPINVAVLKAIFDNTYAVASASTGRHALEMARKTPQPDMIILDIKMPDMDGYAVCETLKADPRTRDIPVLFITVLAKYAEEARGLKAGAVDYIPKPFDPSVVLARVEVHLKLRRILADLSRRNKILEEALNMRDSVERIVRNDLKKPLLRILNAAGDLAMDREMPQRHLPQLQSIEQSGFELLEMISGSIDLWKLERKAYHLDPRPVDIIRILRNVKRTLDDLCTAGGIHLAVTLSGRPVSQSDRYEVMGEELLCYSMLHNLVKNAVESSPEGDTVAIDLEDWEHVRRIRITNTGVVPLEIRSRFMEKGATYGKKDARGLGGYVSRLMAEAMDAVVRLDTDDGRGVTSLSIDFSSRNVS